jgi:site-specific DNA-adenine methylase
LFCRKQSKDFRYSCSISTFTANKLAELAKQSNVAVLISNHDTPLTKKLYQDATCDYISVARVISSKSTDRTAVAEVFALFSAKQVKKSK